MKEILQGKNVIFLGSSVTYGGGYSFVEALAEYDGLITYKEAVNGTTLVTLDDSSYIPRMKTIPTDIKADAFVCQLSTNDCGRNLPLADIEAAVREIIDYARKTWNCPVMFYTSPKTIGGIYPDMVSMLLKVASEKSVYVLDMNGDKEMSSISPEKRAEYMDDAAHPNKKGYIEWWLPKFEDALANIMSENDPKEVR